MVVYYLHLNDNFHRQTLPRENETQQKPFHSTTYGSEVTIMLTGLDAQSGQDCRPWWRWQQISGRIRAPNLLPAQEQEKRAQRTKPMEQVGSTNTNSWRHLFSSLPLTPKHRAKMIHTKELIKRSSLNATVFSMHIVYKVLTYSSFKGMLYAYGLCMYIRVSSEKYRGSSRYP